MTTQTFFWHDYETFGISPRSDRPSQFAGIRTDADLNEIGEPVMLYCQPSPDYLPAPEACLLTGITPQHCATHGVPEQQFAAAIERELAEAGTIGVGYNSIRFDDEVSRFLFWRNLIDPYAREWQNGCSRWDLLDVVRATYALRPDGINWPQHDNGQPSFKLEHLTAANGLSHDAAHDALSDVRATIALARLIREKRPKLFTFCLNLRNKDFVRKQLNLHQKQPLIHVSGMFGSERGNLALVWPLAEHPTNKNEVLMWDLAYDPSELATLDAANVRRRLFTANADLPEGENRLPIKGLHINKSPFVIADLRVLNEERHAALGIDMAQIERHAALAAQLPNLDSLWREVYRRETGETPDVDENLYGGFVSNQDRRTLNRLRSMSAPALANAKENFEDPQLQKLLHRYRARNFPQSLNPTEQQHWHGWCQRKLHLGLPAARTFSQLQETIATLRPTLDDKGHAIMDQLEQWARQLGMDLPPPPKS